MASASKVGLIYYVYDGPELFTAVRISCQRARPCLQASSWPTASISSSLADHLSQNCRTGDGAPVGRPDLCMSYMLILELSHPTCDLTAQLNDALALRVPITDIRAGLDESLGRSDESSPRSTAIWKGGICRGDHDC